MPHVPIYVVHYKPFSYYIGADNLTPFVVGVDDITGDNIANHDSFGEMRCHYWVWRNDRPETRVVFQHYRRAFLFQPIIEANSEFGALSESAYMHPHLQVMGVQQADFCRYLEWLDGDGGAQLAEWLGDVDIVVPRPLVLPATLADHYCADHRASDWEMFVDVLASENLNPAPLPYLTALNSFAMSAQLFDEYMELWWRVMSVLRRSICLPRVGDYQRRSLAFLSERLFTVWLHRLRIERLELRIITMPVLFSEIAC